MNQTNDTERILRRPTEWEQLTGIRVVDPDGWRGDQEKDWSEPIDEAEWNTRMMRSTLIPWRGKQVGYTMSVGEARSVLDAPRYWHGADVRRRAEQVLNGGAAK